MSGLKAYAKYLCFLGSGYVTTMRFLKARISASMEIRSEAKINSSHSSKTIALKVM